AGCDVLDVCSRPKRVCLMSEIGQTLTDLQTAAGTAYPAFFCGAPPDEPTCVPSRTTTLVAPTYTGQITSSDQDGDGVDNALDDCPSAFNPIRPDHGGAQSDADT